MKQSVAVTVKKVKKAKLPQAETLLAWYDQHRRILPWRAAPGVKPDPYHVWLSEVMLQQTTVATVGPYYRKFLNRWPKIEGLAKASLEEVMQMWAGLGYYRRARSLHECAQRICADYEGQFPETELGLMDLPGFGPYTAAAVTAIAFNQRANVVDGNVERVVARVLAVQDALPKAKAALREGAALLLPQSRYGDYAQALMDLGATICTPRNPKCDLCPWASDCLAHKLKIEEQLPRRVKAKARPVRRTMAFVVADAKGRILLRQRPMKGLLGGMMEVPSSPWVEGDSPNPKTLLKEAPVEARWRIVPGIVTHIFSHFELEIVVAVATTTKKIKGKWVEWDRLQDEALPSVMHKIVRHVRDEL